eukprot:TRINITY_DN1741_c0_g1_i2.p1 TRINITY_DN1741_c0_g1~~TRINITY_DN1741_c0_g1_i2.p1  ORF type:complete len:845 (-),score=218.14 TRINITY_DN1741_c0_g1_i2:39-2573(-)
MAIALLFVLFTCTFVAITNGAFFPGYKIASLSKTNTGFNGVLDLISPGPFGADIQQLSLDATYYTSSILRVRITDSKSARWEVPWVVQVSPPSSMPPSPALEVSFPGVGAPFGFAVTRTAGGATIFNSSVPEAKPFNGLIYDDLYLELSTTLPPNANIYGLGERIFTFRLDPTQTYTLFAKDQGTPYHSNLYASQPIYMEMRDGLAHGVFLLNSNAMDVVLQPSQLTYKTIGGVLDLWFFSGPTPNEVIQQYTQVVGFPHMPAYWHLGWHQCRWGYGSLNATQTVVDQYAKNGIPLDTMWNDIDYMNAYKDWTFNSNFPAAGMQAFANKLHNNGQHYMMIVDPGISNTVGYPPYDQGMQQDIFIKAANGQVLIGKVWPGTTAFPDWLHPKTPQWWSNQIAAFHANGVPFDGMWIDMNEPSNFCDGQCDSTPASHGDKLGAPYSYENPPYVPGGVRLDDKTVNLTAIQNGSIPMYNTHNLFGWSEGIVTANALESLFNKRSIVISRSTYAGSGHHHGHWLGDNNSSWDALYQSIAGVLSMNLFGIPLVGADICGFGGDTTEELCCRWMQLGTMYGFSRNHNSIGSRSQEPYAFGPTLVNVSTIAIKLRYSLMPYFYTQFFSVHTQGGAFWKALFYEFPSDSATLAIDRQFMLGSALLVTPVLTQGATSVSGYFPAASWYDWYTGAPVGTPNKNSTITLDAPITKLNVHLRGGYIVPSQMAEMTVTASRATPYTLTVGLDQHGSALGELYVDDGEGLTTIQDSAFTHVLYQVESDLLSNQIMTDGYKNSSSLVLDKVLVYGVTSNINAVKVNGAPSAFTYDATNKKLTVSGVSGIPINKPIKVQWA